MATIFINTENSKTTEPNRFRYLLTDKNKFKKQRQTVSCISKYICLLHMAKCKERI